MSTFYATPLRRSLLLRCLLVVALAISSGFPAVAEEEDATRLFGRFKDRIFQIRVVDLRADEKAALGTGFLVAQQDLIATNFHVISALVENPEQYRLEYVDADGEVGDLELLDIDVINDLALLRSQPVEPRPLQFLDTPPTQGDTIYSLGNPHDIGFTVIPGTYNGIEEGSYYPHIHFSGSINAGMSGGPVLDRAGRLVGINVSSAGNQVSFLVPAQALHSLIEDWRGLPTPITDFQARVHEELIANQRELIESVLAREWPTQALGEATAVGEMKPFVKCWGDSSDDEKLYRAASSSCRSSQQIYLGRGFSTGVIAYQFFWVEAHELNRHRFLNYYRQLFEDFVPDNRAGKDHVGNFACDERFVDDDAGHTDKAILCLRAYKKHTTLYDALYLRGSVDEADKAFVSHFTLAGIERDLIGAFLERFQQVAHR